ncbi:MAG: hypothetical protein WD135_04245 [Ferruginibacter sp.]
MHKAQYKLYRKPWEVLSLANSANNTESFGCKNFSATKLKQG